MANQREIQEADLTLDGFAQIAGLTTVVLVFIGLLGWDTLKALKKRAHWIPGDWLVLSALTIQILNLLNGESSLLKDILENTKNLNGEVVKNNLFMIHSSRVMLCVLVAYLLPGMARPGYEESWGKLGGLVLSIFLHISSELLSVHRRLANSALPLVSNYIYLGINVDEVTEGSFIISGVIISTTLLWLILLLICATIANKSIRIIVCQRIPVILAKHSDGAENSWQTVEDQVLKSWIVARACYPESIIAKSVLASSAALAVTLCILCSVGGWVIDCEKVAAGNASYNLCMSIDCGSSTKFLDLMNELNRVLADIIGSCIDKVEAALVDNCKKWAVDLQERKLLKAVYIASKSRVLIEKLKSGPSVPIGPSTRDDAVATCHSLSASPTCVQIANSIDSTGRS